MNAGKESTLARPAAVLSDALQQAVLPLQPQSLQGFGNEAQSGAAVLAGTQNAVSYMYVLGLRTPLLRQGDMTDLFLSYILVCAISESFCFLFEESIHYLLQGELLFIFSLFLRASLACVCPKLGLRGLCITTFVPGFAS